MKRLLIALGLLLATGSPVWAQAQQAQRTIQRHYFACKSPADLAELLRSVGQTDEGPFRTVSARVFPTHLCVMLAPGHRAPVVTTNTAGQSCLAAPN